MSRLTAVLPLTRASASGIACTRSRSSSTVWNDSALSGWLSRIARNCTSPFARPLSITVATPGVERTASATGSAFAAFATT